MSTFTIVCDDAKLKKNITQTQCDWPPVPNVSDDEKLFFKFFIVWDVVEVEQELHRRCTDRETEARTLSTNLT